MTEQISKSLDKKQKKKELFYCYCVVGVIIEGNKNKVPAYLRNGFEQF